MGVTRRAWTVPVGHRADGTPWQLRFVELTGERSGPTTAFVAGIYGDKPLGCLALHALERRLLETAFAGRVVLVPAANPPALEVGTRINPDALFLNRRFPGKATGFLTDQVAHHLLRALLQETDCIVDLHSGTPTMALWYTYDFGDLALSAAFGYLPVIVGHPQEGQLSLAATRAGARSFLAEFGGGALGATTIGVEGCLNVLRYRGHVDGPPTGPRRVPVIRERALFLASATGALESRHATTEVGRAVGSGTLGWITSVATGERLEEYAVDRADGILLLATVAPAMVSPGAYVFMVGYAAEEVEVSR